MIFKEKIELNERFFRVKNESEIRETAKKIKIGRDLYYKDKNGNKFHSRILEFLTDKTPGSTVEFEALHICFVDAFQASIEQAVNNKTPTSDVINIADAISNLAGVILSAEEIKTLITSLDTASKMPEGGVMYGIKVCEDEKTYFVNRRYESGKGFIYNKNLISVHPFYTYDSAVLYIIRNGLQFAEIITN